MAGQSGAKLLGSSPERNASISAFGGETRPAGSRARVLPLVQAQ